MGMGAFVALLFFTQVAAQTYQEAPMLAEKTAAGELPPVAERLPANPQLLAEARRQSRAHAGWAKVQIRRRSALEGRCESQMKTGKEGGR